MNLKLLLQILQYVTRITDVLLALLQAGNVACSGWEMTIKCSKYVRSELDPKQEAKLQEEHAKQLIADLSVCAKEMETALKKWENEVKEARNHFYELNYYTTRQLLHLRKSLGFARKDSQKQPEIDPVILALLQSISHEVTSESIHSVIAGLDKKKPDPQPSATVTRDNDAPKTASEIRFEENYGTEGTGVETAQLNSMEDLPNNSTVDCNSSNDAKPNLAENDLNETQKATFIDLTESQCYCRNLVLKAFENCKETDNQYDILKWCAEHEDFEEEDEEEVASTENDLSSDLESSDEEQEDIYVEQSLSELSPFKLPSGSLNIRAKYKSQLYVKVVHRQIINESHPIVQKLLENDYDVEDSIDAVRTCGGSLQKAMDYLDSKNIESETPNSEFLPTLTLNEVLVEDPLNDRYAS